MSKQSLRVLLCIGINQNFFDAPAEEAKQVWSAFGDMWEGIHTLEGEIGRASGRERV